jgi:hypothetical protein
MNLYITAAGRYVGTQAEAKRDGKGWTPETVPTDKEGLIAYLNEHCAPKVVASWKLASEPVPAEAANPFAEPEDINPLTASPEMTWKPVEPQRKVASSSFEATEIEDFILNRASTAQVENIFARLGTRFAEIARKVKL